MVPAGAHGRDYRRHLHARLPDRCGGTANPGGRVKKFWQSLSGTAGAAVVVLVLYALVLDSMAVTDDAIQTLRRWIANGITWKEITGVWILLSVPATALAVRLLRGYRIG